MRSQKPKPYPLGSIGYGHWFRRLSVAIERNGKIFPWKIVGISPYEIKEPELRRFYITRERYYQNEPLEGRVDSEFFDGLDVVYVASPNRFHADQTTQSLHNEKVTITEKTFGINREEFDEVLPGHLAAAAEHSTGRRIDDAPGQLLGNLQHVLIGHKISL